MTRKGMETRTLNGRMGIRTNEGEKERNAKKKVLFL